MIATGSVWVRNAFKMTDWYLIGNVATLLRV